VVRMLGSAPHATRRPFVSSRGLGLVLRCLCHSLFLRCGAALVEFFGHLRTGTVEVRGRIPSSADEFVDGTSAMGSRSLAAAPSGKTIWSTISGLRSAGGARIWLLIPMQAAKPRRSLLFLGGKMAR
jgi:hypothetical protein